MSVLGKRQNLVQQCKNVADECYRRAFAVYSETLRTNWFYAVFLVLTSVSMFFLFKVSRAQGLPILWIVLTILFAFLLLSFYKARVDLRIPSKRGWVLTNIGVILIGIPIFSYLYKATGLLTLMPLLLVETYYDYEVKKSGMAIRKSYFTTLVLMGIFSMAIAPYAVGIMELKTSVLLAFYSSSIAIYSVILTIIVTFLATQVKYLNSRSRTSNEVDRSFNFSAGLVGLVRICIVFILVTIAALITGMYTSDMPGSNLIASQLNLDSLLKFYPIVMLGLVAVSFPVVCIYMYSLITNYLDGKVSAK